MCGRPRRSEAQRERETPRSPTGREGGPATTLTHDLDAVQARLAAANLEVRPDDLFHGFRRFYVNDCFGNRLEFLQPTP
jgi:hypothetical protein